VYKSNAVTNDLEGQKMRNVERIEKLIDQIKTYIEDHENAIANAEETNMRVRAATEDPLERMLSCVDVAAEHQALVMWRGKLSGLEAALDIITDTIHP